MRKLEGTGLRENGAKGERKEEVREGKERENEREEEQRKKGKERERE